MIDRTGLVIRILQSRGYEIVNIRHDTYGGKYIHTNLRDFFLKNDVRPWFAPNNVSFKGPAIAVNARSFREYIRPWKSDFLYSWGEANKVYRVDGDLFCKYAERTFQNNGDEVYAYRLADADRWDILQDAKTGQMKLG